MKKTIKTNSVEMTYVQAAMFIITYLVGTYVVTQKVMGMMFRITDKVYDMGKKLIHKSTSEEEEPTE